MSVLIIRSQLFLTIILSNFSNWKDKSVLIILQNVSFIVVKVKRLSPFSNYTVTVSQQTSSKSGLSTILLVILLVSAVIAVIGWIGWFIVIIIFFFNKRSSNQNQAQNRNNRVEQINKALTLMKSGSYSNFRIRFEEQNWVIWLENFTSESNIHLINECSHYFHSQCLSTWLHSIRLGLPLKCPLCSCEVSHVSKPPAPSNSFAHLNREVTNEYTSQIGFHS